MPTFHDFSPPSIDGAEQSLADYRGRAVLVVNVASECGLTPQYGALQALHERYADRGFAVLGFPCNQFGGQEPGDADQIKTFCATRYGVTFPLFAKSDVNGPDRCPLFAWLTAQPTSPDGPGDIKWNFAKFVVGKDGAVVARFEPTTAPDAPEVIDAVERALAA